MISISSTANKCSLEIDYKQFIYVHPNIAIWLADAPQSVLEVMEDVAKSVVFNLHPNYKNIHQKIYVRITNLPVYDQIRNIRYLIVGILSCDLILGAFHILKLNSSIHIYNEMQADPFEHHDPYWRSCNTKIWCFPPAAASEV